MKKSIILALAVCAMSLNSFSSPAVADDKYPASDFQPTVTYIDESVAQAPSSVADDKYPAANFQPKVIFSDDSTPVAATQTTQQTAQFDANYPAAYFTPKVIYP